MKIYEALSAVILATGLSTAFAQDLDVRAFVAAAQEHYKNSLKDPDSAKFKDQYVLEATVTASKFPAFVGQTTTTLCGMVNAKNSYGGYTGFKPFMVSTNAVTGKFQRVLQGEMSEEVTRQFCNQQSSGTFTHQFRKIADVPD